MQDGDDSGKSSLRILLQRVNSASVTVDGAEVSRIGKGLLALVGVGKNDDESSARQAAHKIRYLRIFSDQRGHMNLDVAQVGGAILVVSQFTLQASTKKGRRPSFEAAAPGAQAAPLVDLIVAQLRAAELPTECGVFGADMQVQLTNDGPVTVFIEV